MNANNTNNNNILKIKSNSKINSTSSKPIKKMVLWIHKQNSKSSSPHSKQVINSNLQIKKLIKSNDSGKKLKDNSKEKNTSSPSIKTKDITNLTKNRNYLDNSKINTNKILNSQVASFQSNSNEENKSNSKFGDSSSKKDEKKPRFFNNIKYRKYINMNFSLNNNNDNVNINSSEYHINNTFKYFQASNGINLKKKNKNNNKPFTTDNNIFINPSKKSITKKKISKEKPKKKSTISKKNLYISPSPVGHTQNQRSKKILNGSINQLITENLNEKKYIHKIQKNSFSERLNNNSSKSIDFEKMKNLEKENENLKKENENLIKINKELKILTNKLENEIMEIKSVLADNLKLFLQPSNDMINKSYKELHEYIEKEKSNISNVLDLQNKNKNKGENEESKLKEENKDDKNINEKNILKDRRNNYRFFKKNFFEFFNQINTSNTLLNGYPSGNDPLKNILNSFCCYMDNIMNKLEEKFIKINVKNNDNYDAYINNFSEVSLINIYYQFVIMQLFLVSFFERQHCYYCFSILDYIFSSPFMIIKNNNYIKEYIKKIDNIIEIYKKVNEEYINKFTEQTFFYIDNYIKLFNIIINNKIYLNNNIQLDKNVFDKNTNILFDKDTKKQSIYLDMINELLEKIKKINSEFNSEKLFEQKLKSKNKINLIKLSGDNYDMISSVSNASSKIIENYSEKPSFYGFLKNDNCPPEMSFGDEDI